MRTMNKVKLNMATKTHKNNNTRATDSEQSVAYATEGFKALTVETSHFYCQNIFTLDPDVVFNTKTH